MKNLSLFLFLISSSLFGFSQTTNDVLELLIKNKTISRDQADSVRKEATIKQHEVDMNKKTSSVSADRLIRLTGFTQIRYQNQYAKGSIDGFDIRRARLDLNGEVTPYFTYRLQTDFVGTPKLMDAYADIKLLKFLTITIGQTKIPFSLENIIPDNILEAIDRSQVVEALVSRSKDVIGNQNGRDIGIQIGGGLIKLKNRNLFDYGIGVFNGSGINVSDNNERKDIVGRLIFYPIKGLAIGGSFYTGEGKFGTPTPKNQDRQRHGLELAYEYKSFSIRSEYISGKDGTNNRNGWYGHAGYYLIPGKFQVIFKYDVYDPDTSLSNNLSINYILGSIYNFNSWSKIKAGYTFNQTQGTIIAHNNLAVVQFQISF